MVYKLEEPDPKTVDENQQWERLATARLYRWGHWSYQQAMFHTYVISLLAPEMIILLQT